MHTILLFLSLLATNPHSAFQILMPILTGSSPAAGGATVTFDATANGHNTSSTTSIPNFTLTIGAGVTNGLVFVGFVVDAAVTSPAVTVGGSSATLILNATATAGTYTAYAYCLATGSSTGAKTVTISWTGNANATGGASSFSGVNQTGGTTSCAHSNSAASAAGSGTAGVTITSQANDMVVDIIGCESGTCTANAQGTYDWHFAASNGASGSSHNAGAATITTSWNTSSGWADVGVDIVHN